MAPSPSSVGTFSDGSDAAQRTDQYATLHSKRYLFFRTYPGLLGYCVADDLSLTASGSDFATLAHNRVMNKAIRIARAAFFREIGEQVVLNEDGTLAAPQYYERLIKNQISNQMTSAGALSAVQAFVEPTQDVIASNTLRVVLRVIPVGYSKRLSVSIGFTQSFSHV